VTVSLIAIPLLPLAAAALCAVLPGRRLAPSVTFAAALCTLLMAGGVALRVAGGAPVVAIPGWLACDGLSALVLVLTGLVGAGSALFSWGYVGRLAADDRGERTRRYYVNFNLFLFSLLAVPMLLELAVVWIAVELTTLLSVFLVAFDGTDEALEAAWKYVVLTLMGAAIALLGFLLLYWGLQAAGTTAYTWAGVAAAAPHIPPALLETAFLLVLVGFGAKTGLVPLHTWLPDAHSQAPSPVCALLSGVETTAVLYAILRLAPIVSTATVLRTGVWLVAFGLLSVGVAAFLLIQTTDYKRLFAFSTVEHMGIILAAVGLGGPLAGYGAAYQITSHAVTKAFCFLAAGAALLATGTREIGAVRGLIRTSPAAGAALLLGGLAIAGAPPFAVFLSEFSILRAGVSGGRFAAVGLLTLFIAIAFVAIMSHINRMVFGTPETVHAKAGLPAACVIALVGIAVPVVLLGVYTPDALHALLRLAAAAVER
jgi:hydrogenase-4 component F